MNIFQIIMLLAAAYFSYRVYLHIQTLEDPDVLKTRRYTHTVNELIQSADNSFINGNYKQAALFLQEAYEQNQDDVEVLEKLGFVLAMQGEYESALTYYNKALQIEPKDALLCNKTATAYRNLGQYNKAQELLQHSIALDPSNKATYFNYGNLLIDMNDKDKAVEMYKKALEIDSGFKEAKDALDELKRNIKATN